MGTERQAKDTIEAIEKISGNRRVLLVAPHGFPGDGSRGLKADEPSAGRLAREMALNFGFYAVINWKYKRVKTLGKADRRKGLIDCGRIDQATLIADEFLAPILKAKEEILTKHGDPLVVFVHGMFDKSMEAYIKDYKEKRSTGILIGYGQNKGEKKRTASLQMVEAFRKALSEGGNLGMVAVEAAKKSRYCAGDKNNLSQLFRIENYRDPRVQSIQLEIRESLRTPEAIGKTAQDIGAALLKLTGDNALAVIEGAPDLGLVGRAHQRLAEIIGGHFEHAMREAGQYLIAEFYGGDIEKARNNRPVKIQSLNQLITRLRPKESGGPSKSWVYNAINLAVQNHDFRDFHTYGKLNLSHKVLLLRVHDRGRKEKLIEEIVKNRSTASQVRDMVSEVKRTGQRRLPAPAGLEKVIDKPGDLFSDKYSSAIKAESLMRLDSGSLDDLLRRAQRKKAEVYGEIERLSEHARNYHRLIRRIESVKAKKPQGANRKAPAQAKKRIAAWLDTSWPRIISVSRRTDIPAYYGGWFMNRLEQGFAGYSNPGGPTKHLVSLRPEHVICFTFWSKNFAPFMESLKKIKERGYGCLFHYTITGLPKDFEPNVPDPESAIMIMKELSSIFSPDNVFWRYDPIVISDITDEGYHLKMFEWISSRLEGFVRRCYFSFPTEYKKVLRSIMNLRNEKSVTISNPGQDFKVSLANRLAEIAGRHGITMHSCAGEYLVGGKIEKARCVDGRIIADLFSDGAHEYKEKPTRKECGCAESTDIGAYDTCVNGCIYCYANMNKEKAEKTFAIHDSDSAFLGRSKEESDRWIEEAEEGKRDAEEAKAPVRTTPGITKSGKPFDFFVQREVQKGNLRLVRISKDILGTPRDLETYFAERKANFIVDWFNKAPDKEYCREYWADLRIGRGPCGYRCADCFLILTHRTLADPSRHTLYENAAEFISAVEKWLSNDTRRNTLGLGTDSSDSLLYEGVTGYARRLIPLFADPRTNPRNKHLLLLTKSANVHFLEGLPTKNIKVSFSLNPQGIADLFEGRYADGIRITPPIGDRLEASRKCGEMGFETRWRIDPIIPIDGWKDLYHEFFAGASQYTPQRITLGTYRQMGPGLKLFSKKWGLQPMPWEPPMKLEQDEGVHGQLPRAMRVEIYKSIKDMVDETWQEGVRPILALCKENRDVRKESGVLSPHCNCE